MSLEEAGTLQQPLTLIILYISIFFFTKMFFLLVFFYYSEPLLIFPLSHFCHYWNEQAWSQWETAAPGTQVTHLLLCNIWSDVGRNLDFWLGEVETDGTFKESKGKSLDISQVSALLCTTASHTSHFGDEAITVTWVITGDTFLAVLKWLDTVMLHPAASQCRILPLCCPSTPSLCVTW